MFGIIIFTHKHIFHEKKYRLHVMSEMRGTEVMGVCNFWHILHIQLRAGENSALKLKININMEPRRVIHAILQKKNLVDTAECEKRMKFK